jgi:hypothetical protein
MLSAISWVKTLYPAAVSFSKAQKQVERALHGSDRKTTNSFSIRVHPCSSVVNKIPTESLVHFDNWNKLSANEQKDSVNLKRGAASLRYPFAHKRTR